MTAPPWLSDVICMKSPSDRSPPVVQPRPFVQIWPCFTGCSDAVTMWYVGDAAAAFRLWANCTSHSAFTRLPAPYTVHVPLPLWHVPCSLVSSVWYQARSTRPSEPATIQGNVFVPWVVTWTGVFQLTPS